MPDPSMHFGSAERNNAEGLIALALEEDLGPDGAEGADLTCTALLPVGARGAATIHARRPGVIAGVPIVEILASRFDLQCEVHARDGQRILSGDPILTLKGSMPSLLVMERTALNFLQRLSGVASLTRLFVDAAKGTRAVILDTRKTTPGWRTLEKYAVRLGGGHNHRMGLFDAILIKDNHLAWLGQTENPIGRAVALGREHSRGAAFLEVEVDTLDQLDQALNARPDIILVDNLGPENLLEAVRRRDILAPEVLLEASGGIELSTVSAIAATGVDRISVGALTHSAPALDLGLDYEEMPRA